MQLETRPEQWRMPDAFISNHFLPLLLLLLLLDNRSKDLLVPGSHSIFFLGDPDFSCQLVCCTKLYGLDDLQASLIRVLLILIFEDGMGVNWGNLRTP